jgi:hypothetical protein
VASHLCCATLARHTYWQFLAPVVHASGSCNLVGCNDALDSSAQLAPCIEQPQLLQVFVEVAGCKVDVFAQQPGVHYCFSRCQSLCSVCEVSNELEQQFVCVSDCTELMQTNASCTSETGVVVKLALLFACHYCCFITDEQ